MQFSSLINLKYEETKIDTKHSCFHLNELNFGIIKPEAASIVKSAPVTFIHDHDIKLQPELSTIVCSLLFLINISFIM